MIIYSRAWKLSICCPHHASHPSSMCCAPGAMLARLGASSGTRRRAPSGDYGHCHSHPPWPSSQVVHSWELQRRQLVTHWSSEDDDKRKGSSCAHASKTYPLTFKGPQGVCCSTKVGRVQLVASAPFLLAHVVHGFHHPGGAWLPSPA